MPHPARNHGLPKTVHPASMELAQLLALPRQTLVLLASAWHLVTTVSKARLAERIHAFEHTVLPPRGPIADVGVNSATPQHYCPLTWTNSPHHRPPFLKCRSRSCDRSSRRPFTASGLAHHNSLFQSSKVRRFLPWLLSHHNLRGPSQLAPSVQWTTPQRSKMALA